MSESANVSGAIRFPHLAARDLEGRALELPDDFSGASNLVVVAFRREQQSMVDSWVAWFETIAAEHPTLRCYEVPVIATRWSPARPVIDGGMAQAVRAQEARRRTLTVYTDVRRVTDALAIDDTDTVTVLLVDSDGRLRWRTTGPVTEHAGAELLATLTADASQDAGAAESLSIEQFEFEFDPQFRPFLALIGVTPGTAHVTLTADRLVARFGPWTCETPIDNVRDVCRTGPYRWYTAIGPRGSFVDRGLTFGTTTAVASACCCANPCRASLPSARFVTPGSPSRSPSPNGSSRRCVDARVSSERVSVGAVPRRRRDRLHRSTTGRRARRGRPSRAVPGPHAGQARRGAWRAQVEVVAGDVLDPESLVAAFRDVDAAYYLVHSIGSQSDWQTRDRTAAENFRDAAAAAGVEQIVYLGGLGDDAGGTLSPHLASRHEVGRVLASGPVPLTELRAAVVIGSGSASFEMLRHLVEVLPVMTTPRWVETRVQPIAVRDVLVYLTGVLGNADAYGQVFEIGGADVVTYHEMMDMYAEVAGLRKRVIVPVPVLSPRLSSLWVGLVTPIPADLARPLIDSLVNEVVVHDHAIDEVVPHHPIGCREAIELALRRVGDVDVSTRWTDAELYGRTPADPMPTDPDWAGATVLSDRQVVHTNATPDALFREVCALGGDRGWLVGNWLWARARLARPHRRRRRHAARTTPSDRAARR